MTRVGCFALVGLGALAVHWIVVALLVPLGLAPLVANVLAFLIAFQVSYAGHRRWTFDAVHLSRRRTLPRFFLVALASFAANELSYAALLRYTHLDYQLALLLVLGAVAAATFLFSRQWAFR